MKKKILIGSLFLFLIINIWGEKSELRPYRLINADTLTINKQNEEYVTFLKGNVHFFYGETEFFSDKAELFEKQKISKLIGNVKVYDDTLSLFSKEAEYFRIPDVLFLTGNVFIKEVHQDSTYRTFKSQKVKYDRKNSEINAFEDVIVFDERENFHGYCGESYYFLNKGYGYLLKTPYLTVSGEDTLTISARKIEYFKDYKKIVASFDVDTSSKDFQMKSNFLLYFSELDKAIYLGNPEFYSDFADATAQEFQLFFKEKRLIKAVLLDSCEIFYKVEDNGKKQNWVTAQKMEFLFKERKMYRCYAYDEIDSFYYQEKIDKKDFVENKVTGSELIISFDKDDKVDNIHLKNNIHGIYKFEKE